MSDISRLLGTAVRAQRNRFGFSQEELAFRAGLHRTYVADIERGARNPSIASVAKLAKALNLSVSDFFVSTVSPMAANDMDARQSWLDTHSAGVLLVEDNPDDAKLAIRALQKCNFANHIRLARDGAEALDFIFGDGARAQRLGNLGPWVVLLDLGLPKVDGLEVLRRIKRDPRTQETPVIALAASKLGKDLRECRRLGAQDYIIKPVDFEKFSLIMPRLGFHWLLLQQPPNSAPAR